MSKQSHVIPRIKYQALLKLENDTRLLRDELKILERKAYRATRHLIHSNINYSREKDYWVTLSIGVDNLDATIQRIRLAQKELIDTYMIL